MHKFGSWKRYKSDGEEELFKFLGQEHISKHAGNVEVCTKMEKTDEGIIETYTRGAYKAVTTITGEKFDQVTIDFGDGKLIKLDPQDVINGNAVTFEKDGMTRTHKREYQGTDEYTSTNTFKKGDKTCVSVDYFRKVV